jgi:hypothetical protein
VLEIRPGVLSMQVYAGLLSHNASPVLRNSTSTCPLCYSAWTLRIFQLRDYRWLKLATIDLASDVHISTQKYEKSKKNPKNFNNPIATNTWQWSRWNLRQKISKSDYKNDEWN